MWPPSLWYVVREEVIDQLYRFGRRSAETVATGSIQEIIDALRPSGTPGNVQELIASLTDWLLDWTMTLNRNPYQVCTVIQNGFAQALRESKQIA